MIRLATPFDSQDILATLAAHPRGIGVRDMARHLGISASTASRHLTALREDQWLCAIDPFAGLIDPTQPNAPEIPPNPRWTLNPHRAGYDVLLDWLYIDRGIDVDRTREILCDDDRAPLSTSHPRPPTREQQQLLGKALGFTARKEFPYDIPPEIYRDIAHQARPLWRYTADHHQDLQTLINRTPAPREADLNTLNLLRRLNEALPPFPTDPPEDTDDTRPHLVVLIKALADYARELLYIGDALSSADTLGAARRHSGSTLARRWTDAYPDEADIFSDDRPRPRLSERWSAQRLEDSGLVELPGASEDRPSRYADTPYPPPETHETVTQDQLLALGFYQQAQAAAALLRSAETLDSMRPIMKEMLGSSLARTLPPNPLKYSDPGVHNLPRTSHE